jgi:uncharacterized DUF497 family protein
VVTAGSAVGQALSPANPVIRDIVFTASYASQFGKMRMFSRALPNRDRKGVGALRGFSHRHVAAALRVQLYTAMLTEWDAGKARLNARKHGISFADAVVSLEDEGALTMRDPFSDEEERWVTMGLDALGRVLVVVYTWRGESVRLISARKATPREHRRYEEAK